MGQGQEEEIEMV